MLVNNEIECGRWLFWPSFNGALASNPADPHSHAQFFCVINTVVALLGACVAGFAASAAVHGKFDMVRSDLERSRQKRLQGP